MFEVDAVSQGMALQEVRRHAGGYLLLGVLSIALGFLGLAYAGLATVASIFVFGAVLAVSGIGHLVQAITGRGRFERAALVPIGVLETVAGVLMITRPGTSILGVTLLLATAFIASGIFRALVALELRFPAWPWQLASGIIAILAGVFVWLQWPASSVWVLGTFVSAYCLVTGWASLMLGLAASMREPGETRRPAAPAPRVPQPAT